MLYISNVQHFSVGDGAGIRTTVFFKGCNLRCPWCHNPENLTKAPVTLHYTNGKTETFGRAVSAEALLAELLEDKDFYEESGGGVTLSGGEVLLQSESAAELAKLLVGAFRGTGAPIHVNLIRVNEVKETGFKKGSVESVNAFAKTLEKYGVVATVRRKLGSDVNAACGQLRRSNIEKKNAMDGNE